MSYNDDVHVVEEIFFAFSPCLESESAPAASAASAPGETASLMDGLPASAFGNSLLTILVL